MIFITVGAQMSFDRMVRVVDAWAGRHSRTDVFAQIGPTQWRPQYMRWAGFLTSSEFRHHVANANLIVAHAGMGSVMSALEFGKPILVMPRRGELGETRNDHQVATARRLQRLGLVDVAMSEDDLTVQLNRLDLARQPTPRRDQACIHRNGGCRVGCDIGRDGHRSESACAWLLSSLRRFVEGTSSHDQHDCGSVEPASVFKHE